MTTKEMFEHIQKLDPTARVLFRPDAKTFYVSARVEVKEDGVLSSLSQAGGTAHTAVLRWWKQHTEGSPILVIDVAPKDSRKELRWNALNEDWIKAYEPIDATHLLEEAE